MDSSTPDLPGILKPLDQIRGNDPRAILALHALRRRLRRKKGRAGTLLYDDEQRPAENPMQPKPPGDQPDNRPRLYR